MPKQDKDPFNPLVAMARARHEFGEHGGVNMSIEASTTFTVLMAETMPEIFSGQRGPDSGGCYLYGRSFNPTVYNLGRQLAAMESTEAGYAASSGMGAIASTLMQLCDAGDHVVASNTVYGGTFALLREFFPLKSGVETTFVDISDLAAVEAAITPRTQVVFAEAISNPTLVVADISKLADIAHRHGARLVIDNTFSPMMITPTRFGADVVCHSLTKFASGASDIIAGAVCGSNDFVRSLMDLHTGALMLLGPTMDPKVAHEISLRLPHLGLRMSEHSRRAQVMAERLESWGVPVRYPGLASHPQHELLASMLNPQGEMGGEKTYGFGGIFAIDMGTMEGANRLMEILQNEHSFGFMAVSLGYFETLMSCSSSTTSSELDEEDKLAAGISPGLVRISIGLTGSLELRWNQLEDAVSRVRGGSSSRA